MPSLIVSNEYLSVLGVFSSQAIIPQTGEFLEGNFSGMVINKQFKQTFRLS